MRSRYLAVAAIAAAVLLAGAALAGEHPAAQAARAAYYRLPLGTRDLRLGDSGGDVKTLNWALRAEGLGAPFLDTFNAGTDGAVRTLQQRAGLPGDGVVGHPTLKAIAARMPRVRLSWYGPGLWGRRTACGLRLTRRTVGVAHPHLPCGTRVTLAYHGRWLRARVIDRGPYRKGYGLDLTKRLAGRAGVLRAGLARVKVGVAG